MNDNDPFRDAEAKLIRFHDNRFPNRAAAQRTIVRQHIQLRARRAHIRTFLSVYVSMLKWFKPITLAISFFATSMFILNLSSGKQPISNTLPSLGLAFLLFGLLHFFEMWVGKLVHRGKPWHLSSGWRFELSPAFKDMYRTGHKKVQAYRRAGIR